MFGLARFNAWLTACGWNSGEELKGAKEKAIDYFMAEYQRMLEENFNDYVDNFDSFMKATDKKA